MCIGVWTLDHADYALILCTNRDEFLARPTTNAHFHGFESADDQPTSGQVLSGRDQKAGGTWFGLNRTGRVALLTNITEPKGAGYPSSRGHLVSSYLLSDSSRPLEDEVGKIVPQDATFAGFNLLLLAPASTASPTAAPASAASASAPASSVSHSPVPPPTVAAFSSSKTLSFDAALVTNHGAGGILTSRPLSAAERACGVICNGVDGQGACDWPKVKHITRDFEQVLQSTTPDTRESDLVDRLFAILAWQTPEPVQTRADLRKTVHVVPLPIRLDDLPNLPSRSDHNLDHDHDHDHDHDAAAAAAVCYATRLSTVLLIRRDGQVLFVERDIWQLRDGVAVVRAPPASERVYRFSVE